VLEFLEDRALLSTVFHATDVPQRVDFPDVFTTSYINVPQNLTIANLRVQLNITYPLDNDLTIDLIAPDGTDVSLSSFEGSGANFQNTVFDDAAATPIWAGTSPYSGSYRPETPLSALAGLNAQGTWQLQIVDWGASAGTLNSWSLVVDSVGSPTTASSLVVGGFPTSTTAGTARSFTVTARNANGNVDTGYTGTVHFSSSDPQAALPADYTFTAADAGSHTFTAALRTAGSQALTVTDTPGGGLTGTEAGIAISPAAARRLRVGAPTAATAGAAFNVTVTALDAYGNTARGYTGTVHFTSSDGQATLPADATLPSGTGTFAVTLRTAGTESLTATDTASGPLTGNTTVSVSPAVPGALVFRSTDLPQTLSPSHWVSSIIHVPQSVSIASVKVQLNITYPLDSDLTMNLTYIDSGGFLRSVRTLSYFNGTGANFQDTTFDDTAATPIGAGTSPFAGSYQPVDPLSVLKGKNAQGTWELNIADWGSGSGTVNSWSLIIQPASGLNSVAGGGGTPLHAPAPSRSLAPVATDSFGIVMAGPRAAPPSATALAFGDPGKASQSDAAAAGHPEELAVTAAVGSETHGARPILAPPSTGHVRKIHHGNGSPDALADEVNDNVVL
jgi:subtilisin-like proprotein convertase family protein